MWTCRWSVMNFPRSKIGTDSPLPNDFNAVTITDIFGNSDGHSQNSLQYEATNRERCIGCSSVCEMTMCIPASQWSQHKTRMNVCNRTVTKDKQIAAGLAPVNAIAVLL